MFGDDVWSGWAGEGQPGDPGTPSPSQGGIEGQASRWICVVWFQLVLLRLFMTEETQLKSPSWRN